MCRSASHRHLSAPSSADHVRPRKRCRHPITTAERFTTASFVRGTLPAHAAATTCVLLILETRPTCSHFVHQSNHLFALLDVGGAEERIRDEQRLRKGQEKQQATAI